MVVAGEEGSVNVDLVGDGLAEAVSGERHVGWCSLIWGLKKVWVMVVGLEDGFASFELEDGFGGVAITYKAKLRSCSGGKGWSSMTFVSAQSKVDIGTGLWVST